MDPVSGVTTAGAPRADADRARDEVARLDAALFRPDGSGDPGALLDALIDALIDDQRDVRSDWRRDPWSQGSYVNFAPGQLVTYAEYFWIEANNARSRQDVAFEDGRLPFAGEHTSDLWYGFMNGGAESGRLAATRLIEEAGA